MDKKKKILIAIIAIFILLILVIVIIDMSKKNKQNTVTETANLSDLIDIENIEDIPYNTEKTDEEISAKYTSSNKQEVKARVQASETTGKMIYVRSSYEKLNIYKVEYEIGKYSNKSMKVIEIMQEFDNICKTYMATEEYEETDYLYGESKETFKIPLEESIYYEERLYSKTYKSKEKEYDINYYKKDDKIICEFAQILN